MKPIKNSLLLVGLTAAITSTMTGCAGVDPERPALDAVGGVGAGAITYEVTKNPLYAAGAAGVGVLGTDIVQQIGANGSKKAEGQAYAKGQSDAIKELYWAHQRDKAALVSTTQEGTKTSLYPINIPTGTVAGVNYESQTVYLPVQETK